MYYDDVEFFDTTMFVAKDIEFGNRVAVYNLNYDKMIDTAIGVGKMNSFYIAEDNTVYMTSESGNFSQSTSLSYNLYRQVIDTYLSKTKLYNIIHENNKLYFIPKTPLIAYKNTNLFNRICLDTLRIPNIPRDVLFEIVRALMWLLIDDRTKYARVY